MDSRTGLDAAGFKSSAAVMACRLISIIAGTVRQRDAGLLQWHH